MMENVIEVLCFFGACMGLAITFGLESKYLVFAGIGGALAKAASLLLEMAIGEGFACSFLAALIVSIYARIISWITKRPPTMFLYPSIIPLIPLVDFYYALSGVFEGSQEVFNSNIWLCMQALVGLAIGFVVISVIAHARTQYVWHKAHNTVQDA